MGTERFLAEHWQTAPSSWALEPAAFAALKAQIGALDIARLAGLARGGTQAWLANDYVAHSVVPVTAANAAQFFEIGATLYFLDVPLEPYTHGLADLLGAPRKPVIASLFLTPASGGASSHFDANENFTVQLTGAKHWTVGRGPALAAPPQGHVMGQAPAAALAGLGAIAPGPTRDFDLAPGTLLYVPRGVLHQTGAGELSWSLNLSYGGTMWLDLLGVGLRQRLMQSEEWRGSVSGGALPAALLADLRARLDDPAEIEQIARAFFAS